jgi:hypothetical protein
MKGAKLCANDKVDFGSRLLNVSIIKGQMHCSERSDLERSHSFLVSTEIFDLINARVKD